MYFHPCQVFAEGAERQSNGFWRFPIRFQLLLLHSSHFAQTVLKAHKEERLWERGHRVTWLGQKARSIGTRAGFPPEDWDGLALPIHIEEEGTREGA